MKKLYYAKSKNIETNALVCSFDTETKGLGGEILCLTYSTPVCTDIFTGPNCVNNWLDQVFFKLPSPAIHYAHFAQYDWRYILPELIKRSENGEFELRISMRTESDIFRIVCKKGRTEWIMHDSFAIYSSSLSKFAESFAPEYKKLTIDFDKQDFDLNNSDHIAYAKRDAVSLRQCMLNYTQAVKQTFGISLAQTAAGNAVKAWQETMPDDLMIDYSRPGETEDFLRAAYYGGVVFLTDTAQHENCTTYDINSSYPASMIEHAMPYGAARKADGLQFEYPAVYHVLLQAPDNLQIPIIPTRDEKGGLRWYRGVFETHTTNYELYFALEHGYKILDVYSGLYWKETIRPFDTFINKCSTIRKEHKGKSYEQIAKLMQNSLYGKFGARRLRTSVIFGQENIDPEKHLNINKLYELGEDIYTAQEYADDMPCRIEFAVFITAFSRIRLLRAAYSLGVENVLYGDTDSLTVKSTADISGLDIGDEYGQFKLEKQWSQFRAIAPKTYAGVQAGRYTGKAKGVPSKHMGQSEFKALTEGENVTIHYESINGLLVSLKSNKLSAKPAHRKTSDLNNSIHYEIVGTKCFPKYAPAREGMRSAV